MSLSLLEINLNGIFFTIRLVPEGPVEVSLELDTITLKGKQSFGKHFLCFYVTSMNIIKLIINYLFNYTKKSKY